MMLAAVCRLACRQRGWSSAVEGVTVRYLATSRASKDTKLEEKTRGGRAAASHDRLSNGRAGRGTSPPTASKRAPQKRTLPRQPSDKRPRRRPGSKPKASEDDSVEDEMIEIGSARQAASSRGRSGKKNTEPFIECAKKRESRGQKWQWGGKAKSGRAGTVREDGVIPASTSQSSNLAVQWSQKDELSHGERLNQTALEEDIALPDRCHKSWGKTSAMLPFDGSAGDQEEEEEEEEEEDDGSGDDNVHKVSHQLDDGMREEEETGGVVTRIRRRGWRQKERILWTFSDHVDSVGSLTDEFRKMMSTRNEQSLLRLNEYIKKIGLHELESRKPGVHITAMPSSVGTRKGPSDMWTEHEDALCAAVLP